MTDRHRFAIRTIHQGCVQIDHRVYRPDERFMKYDGRLNGLRYAFGLYRRGNDGLENFVSLWGSEAMYRSHSAEYPYGPELVDGTFPWMWWDATEPEAA